MQIVVAGKAHPRDEPGKELIQRGSSQFARRPAAGRVVFLEDYDMDARAACSSRASTSG